MGFRPRPLLSGNNFRHDEDGSPIPRSRHPMAVGPSIFNAIPQFQKDPARRGLDWSKAEDEARLMSGATALAARRTTPSQLALAFLPPSALDIPPVFDYNTRRLSTAAVLSGGDQQQQQQPPLPDVLLTPAKTTEGGTTLPNSDTKVDALIQITAAIPPSSSQQEGAHPSFSSSSPSSPHQQVVMDVSKVYRNPMMPGDNASMLSILQGALLGGSSNTSGANHPATPKTGSRQGRPTTTASLPPPLAAVAKAAVPSSLVSPQSTSLQQGGGGAPPPVSSSALATYPSLLIPPPIRTRSRSPQQAPPPTSSSSPSASQHHHVSSMILPKIGDGGHVPKSRLSNKGDNGGGGIGKKGGKVGGTVPGGGGGGRHALLPSLTPNNNNNTTQESNHNNDGSGTRGGTGRLDDDLFNNPPLGKRGLLGWCLHRLASNTPSSSSSSPSPSSSPQYDVLSRFLSTNSGADVLRLHIACTSMAVRDIVSTVFASSTAGGGGGGAMDASPQQRRSTYGGGSSGGGGGLLDRVSWYTPDMTPGAANPSSSSSRRGSQVKRRRKSSTSTTTTATSNASPTSLGQMMFPSKGSNGVGQQQHRNSVEGEFQLASWERASDPTTTISDLTRSRVRHREVLRQRVQERSSSISAAVSSSSPPPTPLGTTPFASTKPLYNSLVTRAILELDVISTSGVATASSEGGGSSSTSTIREKSLKECRPFLEPTYSTISVSVLGLLWVLEKEFGVTCMAVQRSLAEVLVSRFVDLLVAAEDTSASDSKKSRRRTTHDGKLKPTKFRDLRFAELVCRDPSHYSRQIVVDGAALPTAPAAATESTSPATPTTTTTAASSPLPQPAKKVKASQVPITPEDYQAESDIALFAALPVARVEVGWVVNLLDRYINDHLSAATPKNLSVPTPHVHRSYKCLAYLFAQFDVSKRRAVKIACIREVKLNSIAVRGGGGASSSKGASHSISAHHQSAVAQAVARVETVFRALSGVPHPDTAAYLDAYGQLPTTFDGAGGVDSIFSSIVFYKTPLEDESAEPRIVPRTCVPSRRALSTVLYLFQQLYPVCTTTCSEEQFLASYVAGSYYDASICKVASNKPPPPPSDEMGLTAESRESDTEQNTSHMGTLKEEASASVMLAGSTIGRSGKQQKGNTVFVTSPAVSSLPDLTFAKTVEYYAADIAGHFLEGGGQSSVRAVGSRLRNQSLNTTSVSVSSKAPPPVTKEMLASIVGDPLAIKRAPKRAFVSEGSNLQPKHTLPLPPLPSSVLPSSPEASALRQLPAIIVSAFMGNILGHILAEEYGYSEESLLPVVTEVDWLNDDA